jgi:hypothetical protein
MSKIRGIILLDGADCCGKTTLAGIIKERAAAQGADAVIRHLGKPEPGTCWDVHRAALISYIREAFIEGKLVIADRHFLSETIYGTVYRTGSEYPYAARHVDRLLHRFRALRVVCAPPPAWVKAKHAELRKVRREEYESKMDLIAARYLDLWQGGTCGMADGMVWNYNGKHDYIEQLTEQGGVHDMLGWYHYDVTHHGKEADTYARFLLHELETEQELIPEELLNPDEWAFTGFPHPEAVLLVGDQVSAENELRVPFLANSGCTLYLAHALNKIRADEGRVVIANINDEGGTRTVRELAGMCGLTIALGREAEKTLLHCGIPFDARVRHPQHARRFNYNDDTYAEELRVAFGGFAGVYHA